jgi:uncharacterized protein YcbK (DUF882 family)
MRLVRKAPRTEHSLPTSGRLVLKPARHKRAARMLASAAVMSVCFSTGAEDAVANGDTRTIHLFHAHTKESIAATYLVGGRYDAEVLKQLNWFLRDWRRDEPTTMDPRLFDVVWQAYRSAGGGGEAVTVMSAYRSPETNAMLRRRSRAVAEYSQHMRGKAMDTSMPGMSMSQVREVGMKMQRGGVGYYPSAGTPFVHLDVGSVRSWPRMSYDQLARLFPDGKTVHLPSNGQPLARYEEARAELEAAGGIYVPPSSTSKNFFAWLFGGGGEEDDGAASYTPPPRQRGKTRLASLPPRGKPQVAEYAPAETNVGDDAGTRSFFTREASRREAPQVAAAERNLPRGETFMQPVPAPAPAQPTAAAAPPPQPQPQQQPQPQPQPKAQVAALEPAAALTLAKAQPVDDAADESRESAPESARAPLPPRRPDDLTFASLAPLPPSRPVELALAYAAPASALRSDPISSVLSDKPGGGGAAKGAFGLRSASFSDAPLPPQRPDIVPARLDRSNFRAMTGSQPAARMTTQSVLGPTIVAPRSAARAQSAAMAATPSSAPGKFSASPIDTPTSGFASQARRRAAITNEPPSND